MSVRVLVQGLALALVLLVGLPSVRAQDLPRCAVAPFEGSGAVVLQRSFIRALEDNGFVSVIDSAQVDAAGTADPAALARATGADLVITGDASGRRRARSLELAAFDASGRQVATEEIRVRPGAPGRRAIDEGISNLLAAALPQISSGGGGGAGGATSGGGGTSSDSGFGDITEEPGGGGASSSSSGAAPAASSSSTSAYGANPLLFVIRLGLVLRTRDAETQLSSGMPRSWRSNPLYAELHAGLELRPLAQSNDLGRGLFIRGEFANAVGLGTSSPTGAPVDTQFFRVFGDVGYLLPIGAAVEVGVAFGFGYDAYDLGTNNEFPSVDIPYLRPALRGRLRLVEEVVVVGLESGLRIGLDRGALTQAFGGGDTIGFDVGASVSGALDFGLAYQLDLTWAGYWHGFSGGGTIGDGQNGTEHGFRGLLSVGYAFR